MGAARMVVKVKSHESELSLWSGHQQVGMYAGDAFADNLAVKEVESYLLPAW